MLVSVHKMSLLNIHNVLICIIHKRWNVLTLTKIAFCQPLRSLLAGSCKLVRSWKRSLDCTLDIQWQCEYRKLSLASSKAGKLYRSQTTLNGAQPAINNNSPSGLLCFHLTSNPLRYPITYSLYFTLHVTWSSPARYFH